MEAVVGILPGLPERDQPVNSCHIIFVVLAECLCELPFLCPDEYHNADVQEDRNHKINPGHCQQRNARKDKECRAGVYWITGNSVSASGHQPTFGKAGDQLDYRSRPEDNSRDEQ